MEVSLWRVDKEEKRGTMYASFLQSVPLISNTPQADTTRLARNLVTPVNQLTACGSITVEGGERRETKKRTTKKSTCTCKWCITTYSHATTCKCSVVHVSDMLLSECVHIHVSTYFCRVCSCWQTDD